VRTTAVGSRSGRRRGRSLWVRALRLATLERVDPAAQVAQALSVDSRAERKPVQPTLSELDCEPGIATLFELANITIVAWHGQPNEHAVDRLRRATEIRRRQYPTGLSVIHLVKGEISLPDAATRQAFVRLMQTSNAALACVAVVVGGAGFWASTARSLVTGMRVLARGAFDMRLHGTVDEVVAWLPAKHAAKTGFAISTTQLEAALRHVGQVCCDPQSPTSRG